VIYTGRVRGELCLKPVVITFFSFGTGAIIAVDEDVRTNRVTELDFLATSKAISVVFIVFRITTPTSGL
jgi:hypothetical protein